MDKITTAVGTFWPSKMYLPSAFVIEESSGLYYYYFFIIFENDNLSCFSSLTCYFWYIGTLFILLSLVFMTTKVLEKKERERERFREKRGFLFEGLSEREAFKVS